MTNIQAMTFFEQLHHIDKDITLAVNSFNCPASDFVWLAFSNKYIWFALYALVLVFLIKNLGWKKALISTAAIVLTITCCDQLGNVCKDFFQRLRPCCDLDMLGRGLRVLDPPYNKIEYGFYSAHAANAMGFAVASIMAFRNGRSRNYRIYNISVTVWAFLVGLSRVFVGKHYLGDICAGFVVGAAIALTISCLANAILKGKTI